jgi:sugar/nucleoside kinase (ribokinase family)
VGIAQLAAARTRALEMATAAGASSSTSASQLRRRGIRVAMAGCLGGSDALGEYGRAQMAAAGVDMLSLDDEASGSITTTTAAATTTGTVMVFTTPDAQRSFLSSFSSEDSVAATPALLAAVARARLVVLEGYLWELPGAAEAIPAIVAHARSVGTLTVLTAGDASVVARHGAKVLSAFQAGVEMFVCNAAEAQELVGHLAATQQQQQTCDMTALQEVQLDPEGSASMDDDRSSSSSSDTAEQHGLSPPVLGTGAADCGSDVSSSEGQGAACSLARVCPMVVVTDGSRGSYVTALGQLIVVPPFWRSLPPVDTCGAGDAYAAGLLHAFLLGQDLHAMGHAASKTASAVISRHGPQLLPGDADYVVAAGTGSSKTSSLAARFLAAAEGSVQQKAVQQQQAPAPQQAAAGEA